MSNEAYPIIRRIFLAQPRLLEFNRAKWLARPINNINKYEPESLLRPRHIQGNSHDQWQMYYHSSVVNDLRDELERHRAHMRHLQEQL